ncbi:MAG: Gfo/Idh/MocA family oxidoreductase [Chloroflexi bacterium]|nr:Gfo/Idh/MocA family oxidoreductase [Chloroflexota bacterium]
MVDVAVVGVGNMGYHHCRVYSCIPGARLVAVADADRERAQAAAKRFGCRHYGSCQDLLAWENVDAISIALPTSMHYRVARDTIAAGVHVLVEKPLAANVEEAQALLGASRERGVVLAVGHVERFNPAVQELKRRIDAGELGEITSIVAKRVGVLPPQVKDANVIVDLAVHDIDIIGYLLGAVPTEVHAAAGRALLSDRFDHAELLLKYGQIGCFVQVNWITPIKIRTLSITGNKGYAELNYVTQRLDIYQSNVERHYDDFGDFVYRFGTPQAVTIPIEPREPLLLELEAFVRTVEGQGADIATCEDGVRALMVAEQAVRQLENRDREAHL